MANTPGRFAMITPPAVSASWESPEPAALPLPPELPPLPLNPRVLILIDGDCVSRGLVEGTARGRACDHEVRACLDRVHATATLLDPYPGPDAPSPPQPRRLTSVSWLPRAITCSPSATGW